MAASDRLAVRRRLNQLGGIGLRGRAGSGGLVLLLALGVGAWLAAPAAAVFPGANGRLVAEGQVFDPPDSTPLAYPWGDLSLVRFSADDTQVAGVVGLLSPPSSIWIADVDGSDQRQLTTPGTSGGGDIDPAWSPDGSKIAFVRQTMLACPPPIMGDCPAYSLMTVDVATGQTATLIAPQTDYVIESLDWSPVPDSDTLVMAVAPNVGSTEEVDLVDTTSGARTPLASGSLFTEARFSPDGESVVTAAPNFQSNGQATISVLPVAGGSGLSFSVTAGGANNVTYPTFTPDGQALTMTACQPGCGIWNAVLPPADAPPGTAPTFQEVLAGSGFIPTILEWEPLIDAPIITAGPTGTVDSADAAFEFAIPSTEMGKYQCQLDQQGWQDCSSPKSYTGLSDGQHTFRARFLPADDPTPSPAASRTWTIDTTPPEAIIEQAPSGSTTATDATIVFTSTEPDGATFVCSVDGGAEYDCDSPQTLTGLGDGAHTFAVKAIDAAGNEQQSPTEVSWDVVEPSGGGGGGGSSGGGGSGLGGTTPPETPSSDCAGERFTKVTAGAVIAVGRGTSCFVKTPQADGSINWSVTGTISLNGVELTSPAPMILEQQKSSIRIELPADTTLGFGSFAWTLPSPVSLPVSTAASAAHFLLPKFGKLLKIAGLPVAVKPDFQLSTDEGGSAKVTLDLELPPIFQGAAGVESSGQKPAAVTFHFEFATSNDKGARFAFEGHAKDLSLFGGAVQVPVLSLGLASGPPLTFTGEASLKFEGVQGTFSLKVGLSGDGEGPFPSVTELALEASDLNEPIAEGVFLQRFGGEFEHCAGNDGQAGASLSANAGVSIGPVVDYQPVFKGSPVQVDGTVTLNLCQPKSIAISGVGTVLGFPLAGAIARYTWSTGKIELNGDISVKLGPLNASAGITNTFFDTSSDTWQVEATGNVKLALLFGVALNGDADIVLSSNGLAACFGPKGARYGVAAHSLNGPVTSFSGNCDVGPYRATSAAHDASADQFLIPRHERIAVIALHSQTAAPEASLHGPGGETVEMPVDGSGLSNSRAVVLPDPKTDTSHVILFSPRAGTWTVVPEQNGPPASIQVADGLPPVHVTAHVSGSRRRRLLSWSIRPVAGQSVTFVEQGNGVAHRLLRTSHSRGHLRFTPAASGGRSRQIEALVTENGLPRDQLIVTHFVAPPTPKLRAISKLRLTGMRLRWSPQAGAAEYSLMLRSSTGATSSFLTHHASVRVPRSMRHRRLTVWISALNARDVPGPLQITTLRLNAH